MTTWTEHETLILTRMWTKGVATSAIGTALNRSEDSVANRARRLDLQRPAGYRYRRFDRWTADQDTYLRAFLSEPPKRLYRREWWRIARYLGRSVASVMKRAKKLGIPSHKPPEWSPMHNSLLATYWTAGVQVSVIAAQLGRSTTAVGARASKLGLKRPEGWHWRKAA